MKKTANAKDEPTYTIKGALALVLQGMKENNWSTQISKNNAKSVVVYFNVPQPEYTVVRK